MAMNKINCVTDIKNTGICGCFFDPKLFIGGVLVPLDRVFTDDEFAPENIAATFSSLILAARAERGFPFIVWNGVTDNQEDPTIFTSGYGSPEPVREGSYNWLFNFRRGGVDLNNRLRSFNGLIGKYGILIVENTNKLIGTKKRNGAGVLGTAGIPLETLYTYPWKLADGSNPAQYRTQIAFRPEYLNENIAFHAVDFADFVLSTLEGLEDINLELVDVNANAYDVTGATDCGTVEDLYGDFADDLARTVAWYGIAESDGDTLVPTSVTKQAAFSGWRVTFAEAVSEIGLAAPAVLAAAPINVVGYEGVVLDLSTGS